jgi:hypothetical protein
MWQRKNARLMMDPPTLVYCREHYPNYFGIIMETLNGPEGTLKTRDDHWRKRKDLPWPEPPMTPSVNNEDMSLKSILPDELSHKANQLSLYVVNGAGLDFAPKCNYFCFTRKTVCDHIKNNVCLNNLGDYILFPGKCFHQGYFNSESDMIYVTAQLFARPTISIACDQLTRSHTKDLKFIQSNLNNETVTALSNDILQNWNTTYSLDCFEPCKNFDGPADKDSN